MIKKILFMVLIIGLLLTGCKGPSDDVIPAPSKTSETGPSDVKVYEQPESTVEQAEPAKAEEAVREMSKEILDIIAKSEKVTSMDYSFSKYIQESVSKYAHVYVKGDKMKQEHALRSGTYEPGTRYDNVYIDLSAKTAVGYCEDVDSCDDPNEQISVNFNEFVVETPLDVLDSIKSAEKVESAMYDNKEVIIIQDTHNGKIRKIWLWTYRGLPLRYELYDAVGEKAEIRFEYEIGRASCRERV